MIWDGSGGNAMKSAVVRLCGCAVVLNAAPFASSGGFTANSTEFCEKTENYADVEKIFYSKCDMRGNR